MTRQFIITILLLGATGCTSTEDKIKQTIPILTEEGEFNGIVDIRTFGKDSFTYTQVVSDGKFQDVQSETPVHLASLTKLFTELTMLRLSDEGKVDLDYTIKQIRTGFQPSFGDRITVRQLMEMKSGLPRELDPETLQGVKLDENYKAGNFIDQIPDFELVFEPGSDESYSNLNYWILGAIIEEITGKNVEEAFKECVFEPLQMRSSGWITNEIAPVGGYYKEAGTWKKDEDEYLNRYTSGGFFSSGDDLNNLYPALKGTYFLTNTSKEWLLGENQKIEVFGSLQGYSNMIILDFEYQFSAVVLNNVGLPDLNKMTELQQQVYNAFGIKAAKGSGGGNRIQVTSVDSLSAEIPLERAMIEWIDAVEKEDEEAMFKTLNSISKPGEFMANEPTWKEIVQVKKSMENFRVAGYRWVENEIPKGIEVWFVSDTEAKIGFLLIPEENDQDRIGGMMVKPVDTKWMGRQF